MVERLLLSILVVVATFIPSLVYLVLHLTLLPKKPWEAPNVFFPLVYFLGGIQCMFFVLAYGVLRVLWTHQ